MAMSQQNPFYSTMGAPSYTSPRPFQSADGRSFSDPAGNRGFGPGMVAPTSAPGDLPMGATQTGASTAVRQSFLPQEMMAPFYNAGGVNANLGTMWAGMMPQVQSYLSGVMSPNLNAMEQNFMNTSAQDAGELMENVMGQQEAMFHNTPFHSALPQMQANVYDQFNRNLLQTGSQLALQRLQTANQAAAFPISGLQQSMQFGPDLAERMFNLSNAAYRSPYEIPLQTYAQLPFNAPTMVQTGGQGKSLA